MTIPTWNALNICSNACQREDASRARRILETKKCCDAGGFPDRYFDAVAPVTSNLDSAVPDG